MKDKKNNINKQPVVLIILDGFGMADTQDPGNAITPSTVPNIFSYFKKYPSTLIKAHGKDVGLFPNQEGNSEAGHFNIGAGRIVEQDLVRISHAIKDGTFFKNSAFQQALYHAQKNKSKIHVMGLLTDGQSAHANPDHLVALLKFLRNNKMDNIFLHIFTDGRDSLPNSALKYLKELKKYFKNNEKIASVIGRFYAMDRNKIWERTEKAYDTMVLGKGEYFAESAEEAVKMAYDRGETDEYLQSTVICDQDKKPIATISDNDVVFFFNARSDRARQITKSFIQPDFQKENPGAFKRKKIPQNICFVAMTDFGPDLPNILTAFPSPDIVNSIVKVIGDEYKQLYISETEKYAHVTFFINGGYADPINGETRELIKSAKRYSYAEQPEMNALKVTERIIECLKNNIYNFICVNYPNADMVGHTGNFKAIKKSVEVVDRQVKRVVEQVLKNKGIVLITADHGNAEEKIDSNTGQIKTEHSRNPVPLIVVGEKYVGKKLKDKGRLADIAPTLLKIMNIKKPKEMTGKSLL